MDSTLDFMSGEEDEQESQLLPTGEQDSGQIEFGDLSHYFERHLLEGGAGDMGHMGTFDSSLAALDPAPRSFLRSSRDLDSVPRDLLRSPRDLEPLRSLLEANRRYQESLRDQVALLEERQRAAKESLRWIHSQATRLSVRKSRSHLLSIKSSAMPHHDGAQQANWHQQTIAEYHRVSVPPPRWGEEERAALAQGIRHQNQGIFLDRLLPPGEQKTASEHASSSAEYAQAVRAIQGMSQRQLETNLEGLDWGRVARLFLSHHRNAIDCRIQWTCNQHPLINHGPWSTEETGRLLVLAQEHGARQWVEVAEALGTNRTAWQCLARFRRESSSPPGSSAGGAGGRKWTAAEDAILLSCVRPAGDWWLEAAERLEGRSTTQIIHRWNKTLDPTRRSGRWSPEEDACLLAAIRRYGTANWAFIGRFVPHRTDMQCRERYLNVLSPGLRRDHFSEAEDRTLREAVQRLGEGRWAQISALLPHRTDNQCRRRWLVISKQHGGMAKGEQTSGGEAASGKERKRGTNSRKEPEALALGRKAATAISAASRRTSKRNKKQ